MKLVSRPMFLLSPLIAMALVACSSGGGVSLDDGWDWTLRRDASWDLDYDFDYYTGEFRSEPGGSDTGLSVQARSDEEEEEIAAALVVAEQELCEGYASPRGDDPLSWQSLDILELLNHSVRASLAGEYTDEYIEAEAAVWAWVNESRPDLDDIGILDDGYEDARDERSDLFDARFQSEYPHLEGKRESLNAKFRERIIASRTSDMVRSAQEYFIRTCDLDVSDNYEYPTPEELDIAVDDEFRRQVEEANA